ncbi:hypothetical protein IQ235_09395 [Oscillatoriales cyanobacterium LEGE 11467]|uniref:Uncharacterized protein n=1 Tax=Zarconia navalis LEGE 11467 TaxID=1828826 RepID=A0A928VZD9_9CYAN|nr:hypothetical protein [Zarconia navalis]MBE9040993.1 hypothetical protein [Zarconia navalis LEGE 11467]
MKLIEIKAEVYEALGVTTTKEVKEIYPNHNLSLKSEWQAILNELTSTEDDDLEPDLTASAPTDWAAMARTIQEYDRAQVNDEPTTGVEFEDEDDPHADSLYGNGEFDDEDETSEGFPISNGESTGENSDRANADVKSKNDNDYAIFMPGHNLMAPLSPWAHYLQWLNRLYFSVLSVPTSLIWGHQNA